MFGMRVSAGIRDSPLGNVGENIFRAVKEFIKNHNVFVGTICLTGLSVVLLRQWVRKGWCYSTAVLHGKTVIITGANAGIGKETARDLVRRGARVIMACRDLEKAAKSGFEIGHSDIKGELVVRNLDLSSLESIREFAEQTLQQESHIHILINNAGLMRGPGKTVDGFEIQFGTNHLGHFLLTNLLLERIKQSAPARIINVSSNVHSNGMIQWDDLNLEKPGNYHPYKAYCQSKLANLLFTKELARRLAGTGVTVYAVHPGFVRTNFPRYMSEYMAWWTIYIFHGISNIFAKTPVQGAQTTIYCAVAEELQNETGLYYSACQKTTPAKQALDEEAAKQLWQMSAELVGLQTPKSS